MWDGQETTAARLLRLHHALLSATERLVGLLDAELGQDDTLVDSRQVGIYMDAVCRGAELLADWLPSEVLAEELEDPSDDGHDSALPR